MRGRTETQGTSGRRSRISAQYWLNGVRHRRRPLDLFRLLGKRSQALALQKAEGNNAFKFIRIPREEGLNLVTSRLRNRLAPRKKTRPKHRLTSGTQS